MTRTYLTGIGAAFVLSLLAGWANAGVSIGATRIIYVAGQKEASMEVRNKGDMPRLIQSWVESETGEQGGQDKAFVVTPPIFRIEGDSGSLLRILQVGDIPSAQESLFWLNVRAIPSGEAEPSGNRLQLSVQSKIKLIYRPESLASAIPEEFAEQLQWTCTEEGLQVFNPSAYYMNFSMVKLDGHALPSPGYIAPKASKLFRDTTSNGRCRVAWSLIGDHGGSGKPHSNAQSK